MDGLNPTGMSQIVAVVDAQSGQPVRFTTIGLQPESESQANGSGRSFLMADALGSIRGATDPGSGLPPTATDFAAFGSPLAPGGGSPLSPGAAALAAPLSRAFAGEQRDPLTGLQNHRARWLDPTVGGWLSPDRVFDFPNNFGSERAYAGLDPANNTDPFGTFTLLETSIVAALQGLITSFIAGTFCEALIKAFFVAAGIDPSFLLDPIVGFLTSVFDPTPAFETIDSIFEQYVGEYVDDIHQYLEPLKESVGLVLLVFQIFSVITESVQLIGELIQLAMSRSLKNAIELIDEVLDLVMELMDLVHLLFDEAEDGDPEPHSLEGEKGSESNSESSSSIASNLSTSEIDKRGEKAFAALLKRQGFVVVFKKFKNRSQQGIDVVASVTNNGPFLEYEIKSSNSKGEKFELKRLQQPRARYLRKLITEAKDHGTVRGQEPLEPVDDIAQRVYKDGLDDDGNFKSKGYVVRVNLNQRGERGGVRIRLYRWIQNRPGIGKCVWDNQNLAKYGDFPKE